MAATDQEESDGKAEGSRTRILTAIRRSNSRALTGNAIAEEANLTPKTVYKHLESVYKSNSDIQREQIGGSMAYWSTGPEADGVGSIAALRGNVERAFSRDLFRDASLISKRLGQAIVSVGMLVIITDITGIWQVPSAAFHVLGFFLVLQLLAATGAYVHKDRFQGESL